MLFRFAICINLICFFLFFSSWRRLWARRRGQIQRLQTPARFRLFWELREPCERPWGGEQRGADGGAGTRGASGGKTPARGGAAPATGCRAGAAGGGDAGRRVLRSGGGPSVDSCSWRFNTCRPSQLDGERWRTQRVCLFGQWTRILVRHWQTLLNFSMNVKMWCRHESKNIFLCNLYSMASRFTHLWCFDFWTCWFML